MRIENNLMLGCRYLPATDALEGRLDHFFAFTANTIVDRGHEGDGIRCWAGEAPSALIEAVASQTAPHNSTVLDVAFRERAVDEVMTIEKHILALKRLLGEFHG